jgi:hypothetical protein
MLILQCTKPKDNEEDLLRLRLAVIKLRHRPVSEIWLALGHSLTGLLKPALLPPTSQVFGPNSQETVRTICNKELYMLYFRRLHIEPAPLRPFWDAHACAWITYIARLVYNLRQRPSEQLRILAVMTICANKLVRFQLKGSVLFRDFNLRCRIYANDNLSRFWCVANVSDVIRLFDVQRSQ